MNFIQQSESAECGLACLGIVAKELDFNITMHELRSRFSISERGTSLSQIVEMANSLQMLARPVKCELHELIELKCPAILHWQMNHYVVLIKSKKDRFLIEDPASGRSWITLQQASSGFTGIAIEISTANGFKKRKIKSELNMWSWLRFDPAFYSSVANIIIYSAFLQVYVVASPLYMQLVIDQAASKGDKDLLSILAIGFGLFAIFNSAAEALRAVITLKLGALLNWDMTARLYRHLIRLPLPWFQKRKLSDILSRFDSINPIKDLITNGFVTTLVDGIMALTTLTMMFIFSPQLALVVSGGTIGYIIIRQFGLPITMKMGMEALRAKIAESSKRIETIKCIQTIKVMSAESLKESDWINKFSKTIERDQAVNLTNQIITTTHGLITSLVSVFIIYFGAHQIIDNHMTIGLLYAFISYQIQFSARTASLFDQYVKWRLTDIYSFRLADIVLTPKESGLDNSSSNDIVKNGVIKIENLSFRHSPMEPLVLSNINLSISEGEFVAITGPSGSGKSTLLKLICGLYSPSYGQIYIDGRALPSWGPKSVRTALGVVLQDDELLAGTVAENICFFSSAVDLERVWACLRAVSMDEDVLQMPMQTETLIGEQGGGLSGGQKQRLILARALYKKPRILILDEATAHIDVQREFLINTHLKNMSITRVVVAHRAETIRAADRVIHISNGLILFDEKNERENIFQ